MQSLVYVTYELISTQRLQLNVGLNSVRSMFQDKHIEMRRQLMNYFRIEQQQTAHFHLYLLRYPKVPRGTQIGNLQSKWRNLLN